MKLQAATQEGLLAVLCYENEAGAIAASMLRAKDFDPVYKEIADLAIDYHIRHKMAPQEHTVDLFDAAAERDQGRATLFGNLFESVEATGGAENFNAAFMLERASTFVRYQRLKAGMEGALRDLSRGTDESLSSAEAKLAKAMEQTDIAFDAGVVFADDMSGTLEFLEDPEQAFPTGIPEFDVRNLGPCTDRLHLLMAQTNKGKSWWLIHLAVQARKRGLKVLYIGLEMSEREINQRMVQCALSISKRKAASVKYERFEDTDDPDDAGSWTKTITMNNRPSFEDDKIEVKLRKRLRRFVGQGKTVVKSFPQGTLSVEGLDNFMTVLEAREKFIPDIVLVDYADIMKRPQGMDGWQALIQISEGLRRIAQQRHVAMASVSQVKASATKVKTVDVGDMSGAWDKVATADTLITYSQSDEEQKRGLARLFVAKARAEEGRFSVMISQAYSVGQFVLDSTRLGNNYNREEEPKKYGGKKDADLEKSTD